MKSFSTVISAACLLGAGFSGQIWAGGPDRLHLGIGIKAESSIYKTVKDETQLLPSINAQKNGFYMQGSDIGYRLIENKNIEIGPVISLFEGYGFDQEDMGQGFKGFATRDSGASYGLLAAFEAEPFTFEIKPMAHSQEGNSLELAVEHEYRSRSFLIMSSLFVQHLDKDYTDYYFGVSNAEANNTLNTGVSNAYKATSATNVGIEIGAFYELSPKWLLSARAEYVKLDSSISDSPLVDSKSSTSVSTSISYRF